MSDHTGNTLKVVQVGCGGMGKGWIEAALKTQGISIVGLVDMHQPTALAAAEKFQLPASSVYPTLTDALHQTDADAVFDVTIPSAHESIVIQALENGRHVLGEKPMSESLASAKRMVDAANRSGKTYAVMQNYRYQSPIRAVREFLNSQSIGPVEEAHADFFLGAHFGGFRDEMDFPLILDMSIHTFDAARFLTNADPVSVYCHSFNPKRSWYKGDASAIAIFEMSNGTVFTYRGSWCAEGQNTKWDSNWRLIGSTGSLTWDGGETINTQAVVPDSPPAFHRELKSLEVPIPKLPVTGHAAVLREFVQSMQQNRKPETDCTDNIKSLAMVFAAVESAKTGKKVPVIW